MRLPTAFFTVFFAGRLPTAFFTVFFAARLPTAFFAAFFAEDFFAFFLAPRETAAFPLTRRPAREATFFRKAFVALPLFTRLPAVELAARPFVADFFFSVFLRLPMAYLW